MGGNLLGSSVSINVALRDATGKTVKGKKGPPRYVVSICFLLVQNGRILLIFTLHEFRTGNF